MMISVTFQADNVQKLLDGMAEFLVKAPAIPVRHVTLTPVEEPETKSPIEFQRSQDQQEQQEQQPAKPVMSDKVSDMLKTHNIDPEMVTGTGKNGRITQKDAEKAIKERESQQKPDFKLDPDGGSEQPTLEDCRTAIKAVNETHSFETAVNVLSRFGVKRVSDLNADQYVPFIEKCTAVVNGAEA